MSKVVTFQMVEYRLNSKILVTIQIRYLKYRDLNVTISKVMHALGFYHEHQRPDRDRFVNFDQTKISKDCLNAFKLGKMNSNKRKSDGKFNSTKLCRPYKMSVIIGSD